VIKHIWSTLAILSSSCLMAASGSTLEQPDIILIVVDDMGWADPGFMPGGVHQTPAMDALAARSVVFTSAYSNGPNCAPSRASLMTGQWTPGHGIHTVGSPKRGQAENRRLEPPPSRKTLKPDAVTLAQRLGAAGYRTLHVGKWHLGEDPLQQGFDVNIGGTLAGHPKSYFAPYKNAALKDGPEGESLTDRLTSDAIAALTEDDDRPCFLHLALYAVHTPLQATSEEIARIRSAHPTWSKRRATYAAMMQRADRNIGRLLTHVDDDAIIVLCSDNGGVVGIGDNGHLRGGKGMLYEGGIRVPLVISRRGLTPGMRSTPVSLLDLTPTLLAMIGAPPSADLDGRSLQPLLQNEATDLEDRSLYWHFPAYLEARGKQEPWRTTPVGVLRRGHWKLLEFFGDESAGGRVELYDLSVDPSESTNLAEDHPDRRMALQAELNAWRSQVGAPMPTPSAKRPPDVGSDEEPRP
jgi:arylsulfatase A-like enzyme